MLTKEQNDALTLTDAGLPGGELLRRYWQPIALSTELPPEGAPVPIDIMGEELVLFRDQQGRVGLLDRHCCHRGTDLSFGRLEDGGLRCLYPGWLYDVTGKCLEQPAEPKNSTFKDKVRQTAYPVVEKGGAFFTYMGPGEPPEFPNYDFLSYPEENIHVHKLFIDCNYLQANEGNYDPSHVGFLHRSFDPNRRPGLNFGALKLVGLTKDEFKPTDIDPQESPRLEVEETSFGVRIFQNRSAGPGRKYLRVTYFCMPNLSVIAGPQGGDGQIGHYHVPIDNETHWRWNFFVRRDAPLDEHHRIPNHLKKPGEYSDAYTITRKRANRFMQDRSTMNQNFTGMGPNFNTHDAFATETPGRIQDRTKEHLATTDIALAASRRQALRAIEDVRAGRDPIGLVRNAEENRFPDMLSFDVVAPEEMPNAEVVRLVVERHETAMV
jgi:phenylpropionate dioxygenase-like ring-hydroxylating dioxygenase large terminal subunit